MFIGHSEFRIVSIFANVIKNQIKQLIVNVLTQDSWTIIASH